MALIQHVPKNLGWKLLAVGLASLVWLVMHFVILPETGPGIGPDPVRVTREFLNQPITVLTSASDPRNFKVEPDEVTVVVSGESAMIQSLKPADIEVFVNLVNIRDAARLPKRIQVSTPNGVRVTRILPENVLVERTK